MSLWELSLASNYESTSNSELSLSPPSYSVQEDPSSGDLRSRLHQIWPDRPEFGRYSLEYEYMENLRKRSEKERKGRESNTFNSPDTLL
ncbi:hypothetical protein Y032_0047g1440 [Ancylostoma ceylanicum]|uniref:Uncharacterized protein n=1 Tax=Ancylostoma ceylanicum TaxID=53326 RepID=A0A016UBN3_9BILA|nr:hypothetical protein Y032_0047g1440 [Ancylostoma ceylanicum]